MKKTNLLFYFIISVLIAFPSKLDFSNAFIEVAEKTNPTVVSIVTETTMEHDTNFFFHPFGEIPKQEYKGQSLGSGVIIDSYKGYIVTNNHVVKDANEIKILLNDKRELIAEIVGADPPSDIALLRVDPYQLNEVKIGNSDNLKVGEWIIAIGSPFGIHLNHTVTAGIVSAVGRSDIISRRNFENFIQHDAAINPGNSGGALMNLNGELIGINTAIATEGYSRQNSGVGFAIPINQVMRVVEDLEKKGYVIRGWLGVSIQDIDENLAKAMKLDIRNGALIAEILIDSPADNSELKKGDIIINIDDQEVDSPSHLKNLIASSRPNEIKNFTVLRNGKKKFIKITLGKRPDEDLLSHGMYKEDSYDLLGLKVEDINEKFSENLIGVKIISIKNGSSASKSDLKRGDIIIKIGNIDIESKNEYNNELNSYIKGDPILLYIKRNNSSRFVGLEIN